MPRFCTMRSHGAELVRRRIPGPVRGLEEARTVDHVGAQAHVTHLLDAAGDAAVDAARAHHGGDEVVGLLSRAALGIDGGRTHAPGLALVQPGVAGDDCPTVRPPGSRNRR